MPRHLSWAKLGTKGHAALQDRLALAGHVVQQGDQRVLADLAAAAGAVGIEKRRFEPYFLWPESVKSQP